MYNLSLFISGLIAHCFHTPTVIVKEVVREVEIRDPSGLLPNDVRFIRRHIPVVHWKPGTNIEQVAYQQGQEDLVAFIENKVMGRRVDRG